MQKNYKIIALAAVFALASAAALSSEPVSGRLGLLLGGNPIPSTVQSQTMGKEVYADYCAGCHGVNGDGRGELAASLATKPADFGALNRPPSVLAMRIHYGVGDDMPPWRGVLEDDTIWHIVNYLETLALNGRGRNEDKWWRPG